MGTHDDYPKRVAKVVAGRLTATAITPNRLAELTGISRMTIVRRLTGTWPGFSIGELEAIALHIGMSISDITLAAEDAAA